MKLKALHTIIMLSKYFVYGVFVQVLLMNLLLASSTSAQKAVSVKEVDIAIESRNSNVKDLFETVEKLTDFNIHYDQVELGPKLKKNISIPFGSMKVSDLLMEISKQADVKFKQVNQDVSVVNLPENQKDKGEAISVQLFADVDISGKITDENGEGLPGATILEKGTSNGVTSDLDGNYKLNLPAESTITISFVGYETQDIIVGAQSTINVQMEIDAAQLEEIVIVGYGEQKKANLTGAVGVANSERLENRPITSAGQGLQGVIPNLNISIRNGDPTVAPVFNIRGFTSINGGSPLILVDNVPMDINRINPNDIESVSVLKDAAAAAVYGARAAFGVVLITTKKGDGKIKVSFGTEHSISAPIFHVDAINNPYEYVVNWNQAFNRTHGRDFYDQAYVDGTKRWIENPTLDNAWEVENGELRFYGNNDYQNKLIADFSPQRKYDLSISGGTEKISAYASFGVLSKDGYLRNSSKNEKFKRYNFLGKVEYNVNDWLKLDQKIVFNSSHSDKPHFYTWNANINTAARVPPVFGMEFPDLPFYITEGDHDQYEQYIGLHLNHTTFNPYLEQGGRNTFASRDIWLTQGITLTPLKGLKIRGDFSYNVFSKNRQDVQSQVDLFGGFRNANLRNPSIQHGWSNSDWIENESFDNEYYVFNSYAEYSHDTSEDHYFKAMVGFNQEFGRNTNFGARSNTLANRQITDINATSGDQLAWGGKSHVALRGMFYRFNYSYKDKYLLEVNGRYDGTSRFQKESRWGFFPSVSAGWRISSEPFMTKTENWLDNLKLRVSYGELGNQLLGNNFYPYITAMGSGQSTFLMSSSGRIPTVSPGGLVSSTLTWETVASSNIGLDFSILNRRLEFSFDTYIRETQDMLLRSEYPSTLGAAAPQTNGADLETKGWELSITWNGKIGMDWSYGLNVALSDNQTTITKYDNPTGALSEFYVGKKIGEIWGYETQGIIQTEQELADNADQSQIGANWKVGDMGYTDINNDGVINRGGGTLDDPGDYKIIGNSAARYSLGLNPRVSYKNLSLDIFFQGMFRDHLPSFGGHNAFYPFNSFFLVENFHLTDTWSETNRDAYFAAPHASANGHQKNILPQSRYVQNAAYVRLKNLILNYNLPENILSKFRISSAQIYFAGQNLWEFSKIRKPLDPESTFTTTQEYYQQRTYSLGVRLSF